PNSDNFIGKTIRFGREKFAEIPRNRLAFLSGRPVVTFMPKKTKPKARSHSNHRPSRARPTTPASSSQRTYTILDYRLERPRIELRQVRDGDTVRYEVSGDLSAPVPPIRESKYLGKQQCVEIYRWMLLNRKMETALENLYKQVKVVGGVYYRLGQQG